MHAYHRCQHLIAKNDGDHYNDTDDGGASIAILPQETGGLTPAQLERAHLGSTSEPCEKENGQALATTLLRKTSHKTCHKACFTDGAQRVWNEALVETQKVALKTASSSSSSNLSVEDAVKQWLNENTPAINEKVEQVRLQLAKEAEPELKRAEELAAKGLIYGTGGAVSEEERARRAKEAKSVDKKTRDRVVELAGIKAFEDGKEDRAAWE